MLTNAMKALYALLTATWPLVDDEAILLHPDKKTEFEDALEAAEAADQVVVRYYQPQLLQVGGMGRFLCNVDVCSRKAQDAATRADELLATLGVSPSRDPTGAIQPAAVPIRETSYHRVAVTFTLLVDTIPA